MDEIQEAGAVTTLVSRLRAYARSVPDKEAAGFVADPTDGEARFLTYSALDRESRRVAGLLQRHLSAGDRALLLYNPGAAFFPAFVGCLYAGVVPAVAPLPDGQRHRSDRLREMVRSVGASVLLTEASGAEEVDTWASSFDAPLPVVVTDRDELLPDPGAWTDPGVGPDDVAFLQFTSGSTSAPRGVVVRHHNIIDNAEYMRRLSGCGSESRFGGWLPMHHDFGLLFLFLFPLCFGARTLHMSASAFLRRPHSWFHMIDRFGLDSSPSPNFGLDYCVRRITDEQTEGIDLSGWRSAFTGAEPVRAPTLRRFGERFGPIGFRPETLAPGYGLAEATLVAACDTRDLPPSVARVDPERLEKGEFHPVPTEEPGREIVCCGDVEEGGEDMRLRIVDPGSRRVLPQGTVGEVWLRGSSVAHGYWNSPESTDTTFRAATADGEEGFLRTGDLAAVHGGKLYITGRIKEVIIYNGRNLYPHDLEAMARSADPLLENGYGAAFTVLGAEDKEEVVVVHEVRPRGADAERLEAALTRIQQFASREFGMVLGGTVLVRPGGVKRTTSGKIQRLEMRSDFLRGTLKPLAARIHPTLGALVPDVYHGSRRSAG
ncbi:fatty acyl-AMP ligase [Nocardiopsis tropica]|uniref:fatty acyl-AMP ligase n=1 Tax=Nocardiopsis tropica TaxID=109330 RepID=UPI0031D2697D